MVHVPCTVGIHSLAPCLGRGPVDGAVERALLGPLACGVRGCRHRGVPSSLLSVHHLTRRLGIAARWRVVKGGGIGSPRLWWRLRAVVGVGGCSACGWALGDWHHALVRSARAFGPVDGGCRGCVGCAPITFAMVASCRRGRHW